MPLPCVSFVGRLAHRIIVGASPFYQNEGAKELAKNNGPLHGGDGFNQEHKGTVTQVNDVHVSAAGSSLKTIQNYDGAYHD